MATLTPQQVYALARNAGATAQEAVILTAIANAESGFRSNAHNPNPPDDSYGLWQINMLGKMGEDRLRAFGLPNKEALFNPLANAKAAIQILRSQGFKAWSVYGSGGGHNNAYQKFLGAAQAAGVAVNEDYARVSWETMASSGGNEAYWSGPASVPEAGSPEGRAPAANPQPVGQPVGPATNANLGTSVSGQGAMPGTTIKYGDPGYQLPANASPQLVEQYIKDNYGAFSWLLKIPELYDILTKAAKEHYDQGRLDAAVKNSNWWKMTAPAIREWESLYGTDPSAGEQKIREKQAELRPLIAQTGADVGDDDLRTYAYNVLRNGMTEDQVRADITAKLEAERQRSGLDQGTTVAVDAASLAEMARRDYLVPLDMGTAQQWAIRIFGGTATEDQFKAEMLKLGSSRMGGVDVAATGATPGMYMAPIRNEVASILEVAPDSIDLLSPQYSMLLQHEDAKGALRPMTLNEAQQWARSTPTYQKTKGAGDSAAQFGEFLGQTFGKV